MCVFIIYAQFNAVFLSPPLLLLFPKNSYKLMIHIIMSIIINIDVDVDVCIQCLYKDSEKKSSQLKARTLIIHYIHTNENTAWVKWSERVSSIMAFHALQHLLINKWKFPKMWLNFEACSTIYVQTMTTKVEHVEQIEKNSTVFP